MNLKEVFVSLALKSGDAKKDLKAILDLADKTADGLKDVDESAEDAGESLEDAAKKGKTAWQQFGDTHKRVVDAFGKTKDFREFGKNIAASVAVGAAAIVGVAGLAGKFVADWAHGATEIERTAKQYGLSAQALQEWQFAARATGGEAESIQEIFKELSIRITEVAETGTGPATDALTLLRLRASDLKKLAPEKQMELLADRISQVADAGTRFFLKDSLFGEEGSIKVGTLLENGAAGIAALRKEAQGLGGVLDGSALKAAKSFNKEIARTDAVVTGLKSIVGQALLPVIREWIVRGAELVKNNRELIAQGVDRWAKRLGDFLADAVPALGKVVGLMAKFIDQVGGIEPALKLAAGGWAAWQLAGLAAINTVGAALALFMVSFAAGMKIGEFLDPGESPDVSRMKFGQAKIAQYAKHTDAFANDESLNGRIARKKFEIGMGRLAIDPFDADADKQVKGAIAEFERITAAREAGSLSTGAPLGKVKKPGAEKPITLEQLIKDARKEGQTIERYTQIRKQLEEKISQSGIGTREEIADALRMGAESPSGKAARERLILESALKNVNSKLGTSPTKSLNEMIAEGLGQGTGLGGAALKPAGLGTSINQIDASITINMGGLDIEMPTTAVVAGDPRGSGQQFGQSIADYVSNIFQLAYQHQRAQING